MKSPGQSPGHFKILSEIPAHCKSSPNIYIYVQSNFEGPLILNICEQIYFEDLIPNNKILKIVTLLGPGDSKQGSQTKFFQLIMIRTKIFMCTQILKVLAQKSRFLEF